MLISSVAKKQGAVLGTCFNIDKILSFPRKILSLACRDNDQMLTVVLRFGCGCPKCVYPSIYQGSIGFAWRPPKFIQTTITKESRSSSPPLECEMLLPRLHSAAIDRGVLTCGSRATNHAHTRTRTYTHTHTDTRTQCARAAWANNKGTLLYYTFTWIQLHAHLIYSAVKKKVFSLFSNPYFFFAVSPL